MTPDCGASQRKLACLHVSSDGAGHKLTSPYMSSSSQHMGFILVKSHQTLALSAFRRTLHIKILKSVKNIFYLRFPVFDLTFDIFFSLLSNDLFS